MKKSYFSRFFGHLGTVLAHKREVAKLCRKIGMPLVGLRHDLSKFTPAEFSKGVKYYTNGKKSPNEGERIEFGYSLAWMHHKGRNKHHFEYWNDYNPIKRKVEPAKMPLRYVAEMFCDRVAASKIYQKDGYQEGYPLEYFQKGKPTRFIHPETSDFLEKLLTMLKDEGEKKTFIYLKKLVKENRKTKCEY